MASVKVVDFMPKFAFLLRGMKSLLVPEAQVLHILTYDEQVTYKYIPVTYRLQFKYAVSSP